MIRPKDTGLVPLSSGRCDQYNEKNEFETSYLPSEEKNDTLDNGGTKITTDRTSSASRTWPQHGKCNVFCKSLHYSNQPVPVDAVDAFVCGTGIQPAYNFPLRYWIGTQPLAKSCIKYLIYAIPMPFVLDFR